MAASSGAFLFSRASSPQPPQPPFFALRRLPPTITSCLSSTGGGGGISSSDDHSLYPVSTHKSKLLDMGFGVIGSMLRRIEPLDNSVISQGVSEPAKDSMKQTVSTILGLLPSDSFSVTVRVSFHPLFRLLVSAIITGYTLWNAEYRMLLTRKLDLPVEESVEKRNTVAEDQVMVEEATTAARGQTEERKEFDFRDSLVINPNALGDLSPEALNYIQQLKSELSSTMEELDIQRQETKQLKHDRGNRNDLLEYLRSLDPYMVTEISQPSSAEVEDIIHQLVQNILPKISEDDATLNFVGNSVVINEESKQDAAYGPCDTIGISRDYLAKLLFWCTLLGHHLRGLENRLHLSFVVGLL